METLHFCRHISNCQDNLNRAMQKSKIFSYLRSILLTLDGRLRWRPQRNNRARGRTQACLLTSLPTQHAYSQVPQPQPKPQTQSSTGPSEMTQTMASGLGGPPLDNNIPALTSLLSKLQGIILKLSPLIMHTA